MTKYRKIVRTIDAALKDDGGIGYMAATLQVLLFTGTLVYASVLELRYLSM